MEKKNLQKILLKKGKIKLYKVEEAVFSELADYERFKEAMELADDDLGNCGYDPDDEHPFGPMAGSGMSLSERVDAYCSSFVLPFRSSDIASEFGLSHQKITSILRRLGWPRGITILEDHGYGMRWFPKRFDPLCAESSEPPYAWSELHEDDRLNTWDKHGPTPDRIKRPRRRPRR